MTGREHGSLDDRDQTMVQLYRQGIPLSGIAEALGPGVTANQVSAWISRLRAAGLDLPPRPRGGARRTRGGQDASATIPPPVPPPPSAAPPQPIPDARLAILLRHVDGSRPSHAGRSIDAAEAAALAARPDLVWLTPQGRYRLTAAGKQWAREHDPRQATSPAANRLYCLLRQITGISHDDVVEAMRWGGLDCSSSQADGWRRPPADRRHTPMTLEQLERLMQGIAAMDRAANQDRED